MRHAGIRPRCDRHGDAGVIGRLGAQGRRTTIAEKGKVQRCVAGGLTWQSSALCMIFSSLHPQLCIFCQTATHLDAFHLGLAATSLLVASLPVTLTSSSSCCSHCLASISPKRLVNVEDRRLGSSVEKVSSPTYQHAAHSLLMIVV